MTSPDPLDTAQLTERREFVRRSVLRANRFIAAILGVVVLLGVILVMLNNRSLRNQRRAETAETEATERLWQASLDQARAEIASTQMGHREAALAAIRTAAAIRPSAELRKVALAALSQRDLVLERSWNLGPNAYGFNFDPDLKHYVVRYAPEVLSMHRLDDNAHVRDFPLPLPLKLRPGANVGDFMFSATGRYVVIRYNGGAVALYEASTGKLERLLGLDPVTASFSWPPSFTADDRLMCLTMTGNEGLHVLYDVVSGRPRKLDQLPPEFRYAGGFTNYLRLSPRGDFLAWHNGSTVSLLDAATGALRHTLKAASVVQSLNWDEQGERLAFVCDNFSLHVLDVASQRITRMGGTAVESWIHRFSYDGRLLMTSGNDGFSKVWDVVTARLICETDASLAHGFSRDGSRISWGIPGRKVGVWRVREPAAQRSFACTVQDRTIMWQTDLTDDGGTAMANTTIWSPRQGLDLIELATGNRRYFPLPSKHGAGFHPDMKRFWIAGASGIRLHPLTMEAPTASDWATAQGEAVPLPSGFVPFTAGFSADGSRLAVSGQVSGSGAAIFAMDTAGRTPPVRLEGGYFMHASLPGPATRNGSGSLAVSPDGRWVVASRYAPRNNIPIVWDATSGKVVARLDMANCHLAFSRDGRHLFGAGYTMGVLWETGTWRRLWTIERPLLLTGGTSAAFSEDDGIVAWNRGATQVDLLDARSGTGITSLSFPELGYISSVRFSADGRRLLCAGAEGRLVALDLPEIRTQLAGLGLDWPLPASAPPTPPPASGPAWLPIAMGLLPVALAGMLGVLVLRRQNRLTREFVETTEVAARAERELAAEREVSELKSRFVTTVSHEFRTPLGITMSAVELLRHYEDRLPPEERRQLFDDIHLATRNMAGLMEQVLVLGRVDAGKLACRPAPLDLESFAQRLSDESLSATNRKCAIEWTAENDLSGAHADEALLRHIFTNLLGNAVKYSAEGSRVEFRGRREGLMAVFTVADHGIGIPETDLPRLFEAFHRGSNVGDIPGTGLGLVIIKRCAELHGGSIQVKSTPGEGTTFTVRIPAWA